MSFDFKALLDQAKNMQENMQNIKNELAKKTEVGTSGGGMVEVTMNGEFYLSHIKLSDDLIASNDLEMTKDLIRAAVNDAITRVKSMQASEFQKVSHLVPNIPGFNFGI